MMLCTDGSAHLNTDVITRVGEDLGDLDVADDNVGNIQDTETDANER